jgi:3-deoxy-manno-octulosonate cytidylyltransferase (CMP-KDO synthetase)
MRSLIVIPARWGSTRFPGKPLAQVAGVSLIQRVYDRVNGSARAGAIYVATDDDRILGHVLDFGGKGVKTEGELATGTDRIAAALPIIESLERERFEIIVNVQGDEPLIDTGAVDSLIERLAESEATIVTLACPLETEQELHSRDVVKVVLDLEGNALYFSRAAIGSLAGTLRHVGVYAYRRAALEAIVSLPQSPLEKAESLEQLRAMQHGFRIAVSRTSKPHLGVDRPEDVAQVERELARQRSQ